MASSSCPKAEYAIFDMDGLLKILKESIPTSLVPPTPVLTRSLTADEILNEYGFKFTWDIKAGIMGKGTASTLSSFLQSKEFRAEHKLRIVAREAAEYTFAQLPGLDQHISVDDYMAKRHIMQEQRFRKVKPMEGALELVKGLHAAGVPIALATGSSNINFEIKTVSSYILRSHLPELFSLFPQTCILTADSPEIKPGRGKPHPDIFLAAAHSLGRDVGTADECSPAQEEERRRGLVFEDAVPGCKAGTAAGMNVIWVPDANLRALDPSNTYGAAQILASLEEFKPSEWGLPFKANA